ncbi:MAG: purine/pyrimidine permease [Syntrophobacteraceae bacterium]|nr:purine/pyrimidine permease [Syntrophobacteraceae bacterium]
MNKLQFIYDLDDRPPIGHLLLYGVQWAMIMFPALIIVAGLSARALHMGPEEEIRFFQFILLTSGGFTAVQTLMGHRYPVLDGPATALLLTVIVLAPHGLPVIQGGTILGGLFLIVLVATRQLQRVIHYATPNVVGVILMLIGFTLLPHIARSMSGSSASQPEGSAPVFIFSLALVLLMACVSYWLKGFWKTVSLLAGMLLGTLAFSVLHAVDWSPWDNARWISMPTNWVPSLPTLYWPSVVAFVCSYVAVLVNSLGSLHGIAKITDEERLGPAVTRGVLFNGIGGIFAGLFGVVGTVSYSISPGVVLANRVASRYATFCCGIILLIAAFVPKLAAVLAMVPAPVVGAALCVAMGAQVGAALSVIAADGISARDYYVVGVPLLVGTLVGFLPEAFLSALPAVWQVFLGNGLIVGIFLALLLEHVLLRKNVNG